MKEHIKNMDKKMMWGGIAVLVILIGGSFFGGYKYAQGKTAAARGSFAARTTAGASGATRAFGGMGAGRGGAGGFTGGQVVSVDTTSMTVKGPDGSSKIIFFTDATPVMKSVSGKIADVIVGSNITITGTPNSDGSITAQNVQIRPEMQGQTKAIN